MDNSCQALSFVAATFIGIVALATFYGVVGCLKRFTAKQDTLKMKRFNKDGRAGNARLSSGRVLSGARFIGFTDQSSTKDGTPLRRRRWSSARLRKVRRSSFAQRQ